MMRFRLWAVGTLATLLVTAAPLFVRAQTNPPPAPSTPGPRVRQGKERHPALMVAMRALQRAKGALVHANRDFGGHRTKAVQLTEQAMQEIQQAIQYDKN
jgi:hypothetical protein